MPNFTHNINIISRCTTMQRSEQLQSLGLCGGQAPYLLQLCRHPGQTQEELSRAMYVNKSTVARQIAHLEQKGFVDRRPCDKDRRCIRLYPTQQALDALPAIRNVIRDWNDYLICELSEEEQAILHSALARMSARAQAYVQREVRWDS